MEDMKKVLNEFGYTMKKTEKGNLFRFWNFDRNQTEECYDSEIDKMSKVPTGYRVMINRPLGKVDYLVSEEFAECLTEVLVMKLDNGEYKSTLKKEETKPVETKTELKAEAKTQTKSKGTGLEIINQEFIMRDDLRDWVFKEDKNGSRYRERIFEAIQKLGVEKWYKAKGYPTSPDSVWKNRYTASLTKLSERVPNNIIDQGWNGLTFWENWLPIETWNNKELFKEYKEGTKEYAERLEKEAKVKKYEEKRAKAKTNEKKEKKVSVAPLTIAKDVKDINEPKVEPVCSCGRKLMWDINIRDKCDECNRKHFIELFNKAGLDETGYSVEKKKFYSHTTGVQSYDLKFVMGVNMSGLMSTYTFPCVIYICDEFGCHNNTLGITREFADYLIKELKLVKNTEGATLYDKDTYKNPLIREDKEGKKRAELEKEIQKKQEELNKLKMTIGVLG